MLELCPLTIAEAVAFVAAKHRHHKAKPAFSLFAIGVKDRDEVVGVAIIGNPVARLLNDGYTAEVTRLCTDGRKNACSMLYAAAWRAARAMGYRRIGTYILDTETGASLKAAGWCELHRTKGGSWSRQGRPRVDKHPTQSKLYFGVAA